LRSQAIGSFFILALLLGACGGASNSISADVVATVAGTPITKADYERWATITARTAASAQLLQRTMSTLLHSSWIEGEARAQGVSVTDAEVQERLVQTKEQSFPTAAAYEGFLKQFGMSQQDVLYRLRIQLLLRRLTTKIEEAAAPVTAAQISAYYERHRAHFAAAGWKQTSLLEASGAIRSLLEQEVQRRKMHKFTTDFERRWRAATSCHPGYVMDLCGNSSKPGSAVDQR
jgi:hypothetical protein